MPASLARFRFALFLAVLWWGVSCLRAGQVDTVNSAAAGEAGKPDGAAISAQDSLRGFLEIQEQLHNTQQAIEKNRRDTESAFATNTQLIQARLDVMDAERLDALKTIQHSLRIVLIGSGIFVSLGFLVLLCSAALQLATIRRLADVAAHPPGQSLQNFSLGDGQILSSQALEQTSGRLLTMIDRLEKRILEIESGKQLSPALANGNGHQDLANDGETPPEESHSAGMSETAGKVRTLMGKGQTLLKLDKAEEALACLDEVLAIDPGQLEALIKKGAALERLQRFTEAIACYDMAIARDATMTMAYLYKGAVFNRLERYGEALECYEQALKSRQKKEQSANVVFGGTE